MHHTQTPPPPGSLAAQAGCCRYMTASFPGGPLADAVTRTQLLFSHDTFEDWTSLQLQAVSDQTDAREHKHNTPGCMGIHFISHAAVPPAVMRQRSKGSPLET